MVKGYMLKDRGDRVTTEGIVGPGKGEGDDLRPRATYALYDMARLTRCRVVAVADAEPLEEVAVAVRV